MSDESTPTPIITDNALLDAWRTLMYFDNMSASGRKNFKWLRRLVIAITLIISVISVLSLMFSFSQSIQWIILALPIIGLNLMSYTSSYSAPTVWIEHRYAAEKIRSEIYLYRSSAEKYAVPKNQQDNILQKEVAQVLREAPHGISDEDLNDSKAFNEDPIKMIQGALTSSEDDDGFKDLSDKEGFEQYIKTRINGQINWYRNKVKKDYIEGKHINQFSIILVTIGSVIGLIAGSQESQSHWIGLFAIVNATGMALNAYSNVNMTGRTYGIYDKTWKELKISLSAWNAQLNDDGFNEETQRPLFVENIENILMGELDKWYEVATEVQITNDTSLKNGFDNSANGTAGTTG
ncbi:MAG: DUF4231 domain-containing protein [Phototrophicales bacterium]|nr:DUF4231 domain-containing protein [Phototrophicales bacterium]